MPWRDAPSTSAASRGYGQAHRRRRKADARRVEAGLGFCWRCGQPIVPLKVRRRDGRLVSNWHLGHDDNDRTVYRGPEHESCNLKAAARKGRRLQGRGPRPRPQVALLRRRVVAARASRQW